MLRTTLTAAVLVALPSIAAAGGFVEGVAGGMVPLADDEYTDTVDASLKLGVRAGSRGEGGAGVEVGLDFTPVSFVGPTSFGDVETTAQRFRVLLGSRFRQHLRGPGFFFVRAGAGVDIGRVSTQGTFFGAEIDESQTDIGFALEFGLGLGVDLGTVYVSGQLAVPLAFHFDEDEPSDSHDYDFDYNAVDLDLLFSVGTTL